MRAALAVSLLSIGLVASGLLVARHDQRGEPVRATVLSCDTRYKLPPLCRGIWVAGGSLLDGGRTVSGTIDGAGKGDVGKELGVRAAGDSAWTVSGRIPILLIGAGAAVAVAGAVAGIRARRRRGA